MTLYNDMLHRSKPQLLLESIVSLKSMHEDQKTYMEMSRNIDIETPSFIEEAGIEVCQIERGGKGMDVHQR